MSDGAALTVKTLEISRRCRSAVASAELVEQRADTRKIAAAGFGHRDAPRQSPEQRDTQPVLEQLDQTPHGIGRNVELGARRFEAAQARRCFECPDRVERRQTPASTLSHLGWGAAPVMESLFRQSRPERVRVNPQVVSRYIDARRDLQAGRYPMRAIRYATGFAEILEVQVLGYRERLTSLRGGGRQRVLDPVCLFPRLRQRSAAH